jgi:hypothetical protein
VQSILYNIIPANIVINNLITYFQNSKKQEQKIMRLEKAHRENEELYKTIKHLLTINIAEIEESAINKAKKLLRDAEANHLS